LWIECSDVVGDELDPDEYKSVKPLFPDLLNSYRVLMYNGQFDYVCNGKRTKFHSCRLIFIAIGTDAFLGTIEWPYQLEYLSASRNIWSVDGAVAGRMFLLIFLIRRLCERSR